VLFRSTSIEHNQTYYGKMRVEHPYAKVVHIPITTGHCLYATTPITESWGLFDTIFIDGRRRMECLLAACVLLNAGGRIILHDAERKEYQLRYLVTRELFFDRRTAVMVPKALVLDDKSKVGELMTK